ncbi:MULTISPECIES: CAP domain-containing protein, partial [Leuconostoc]
TPAASTSSAPAAATPSTPAASTSSAPAAATPSTPAASTSSAPAAATPSTPATSTSSAPAATTPSTPATSTSSAPAATTPVKAASAQPSAPAAEKVSYIAAADANRDGFMTTAEYNAYKANGGNKQAPVAAKQSAPVQVEQVSKATTTPVAQQAAPASSAAQTMLNSLNAKRASLGLGAVTLDAGLSARAQSRAVNAVANGGLPTNHFATNGEVVAIGWGAGNVIDAWYNETNMITNGTPGHRMWVANARATSVGFGIVGGTIVAESNAGQY